MRGPSLRRVSLIAAIVAVVVTVPLAGWLMLTHQPTFYRRMAKLPREQREAKAKHFVASSLQLRNDIANELNWEAVFSDQEVNAWLAEDLVTYFADQIPPEVHEPRIAFESDRVTLAFQLDQGPIRSVIWVVARARVPEDNVLALTIEKVRAGVIPISVDRFVKPMTDQALDHGLDVAWSEEDGLPVAQIRFRPEQARSDVILERLKIRQGQIRLSGRSDRPRKELAAPRLPSRRLLQLTFPRRSSQPRLGGSSARRKSATPTS
ncbi:hypothetical protein TA3x_001409 [Tundrisphaera sp. TA3]|uniref:hypothetical protein n=1 Tax=Tundrisphaera sp. TA3 TaxID=3435775 RepID=UPI003EC0ADF5